MVERDAYGRRIGSTIVTQPTSLPGGSLEMVFIRATRFMETGIGVEELWRARRVPGVGSQGNILAATFVRNFPRTGA